MALVNYFGAADKLSNPGAGLTTPYLTHRADRRQVLARHDQRVSGTSQGGRRGPDGKGLDQRAKDLLTRPEGRRPAAASTTVKAAAMTAPGRRQGPKRSRRRRTCKATIDKWDKQIKDGDFADLTNQWKSDDAYAADAYRLVAANPNICTKCHSIGSAEDRRPQRPRPEPRLRAAAAGMDVRSGSATRTGCSRYSPTMPQNFPKDSRRTIRSSSQATRATVRGPRGTS